MCVVLICVKLCASFGRLDSRNYDIKSEKKTLVIFSFLERNYILDGTMGMAPTGGGWFFSP